MAKLLLAIVVMVYFSVGKSDKYEPTWESLDSRPLPQWYDEAKVGIFIVWGIYSVPSFYSEWFWEAWKGGFPNEQPIKEVVDFMEKNYPPDFTYADFASMFKTEFFNPDTWVEILKSSGAKYIVLTTKHHEGYTLYPSNYSFNWNSKAVGPNRDLVGEIANALKKSDIKLGLYHSLFEWFNPMYLRDRASNFTTQSFVKFKTMPELYEIVNAYKPDVIWSDGDYGPDTYWTSKEFLAWLYNESPVKDTVVTNDRWGNGCSCHHGGFLTCTDKYNPGVLQKRKWENCMTIDRRSWGYRRNALLSDFLDIHELLSTLASTVSCGGNILINIAPTKEGMIIPIFAERLRQLGKWLGVNGESIYSSKPWSHQNDTITKNIWYTKKSSPGNTNVYAILLNWPKDPILKLGAVKPSTKTTVTMLGYDDVLFQWVSSGQGMDITIPVIPWNKLPCEWAWVLKITYVLN